MATLLLCVTGSIAAYKAADLASRLKQAGHDVTTLMTRSACQLVSPHTFLNLTGNRVYTDLWDPDGQTEHIALTDRAQLVVVAPATANVIAKLAHGIADDMVTTTLLAVACPVLVCPAMNTRMWRNQVVQRNVRALAELGHEVLLPASGALACGHVGPGRLPEPPEIERAIERLLAAGPAARGEAPAGPAGPVRTFLEVVTLAAEPTPAQVADEERFRRAALASGALAASGWLGPLRAAHVHRARDEAEAEALARRSPLHGLARVELLPWDTGAAELGRVGPRP